MPEKLFLVFPLSRESQLMDLNLSHVESLYVSLCDLVSFGDQPPSLLSSQLSNCLLSGSLIRLLLEAYVHPEDIAYCIEFCTHRK